MIYHYTNISTLLGMFNNCSKKNPNITMWATHSLYLNDPTEYEHGKEVCLRLLKSVEEDYNIPQEKRLSKAVLDGETGIKPYLHLMDVANSMTPKSVGEGTPYIISLSENRDSLPMWNTYAQRGNGIAIGFDQDLLKKEQRKWVVRKCYYDVENKEYNEVKNHIRSMYDEIERLNIKGSPLDVHQTAFYIQELHSEIAAYIKHKAYKDEREVRCKIRKAPDIRFRESNGLVIPYVEVEMPVECVKEIIIGPSNDSERMSTALFMLVNNKGCKIKIEKSQIPYRG